MVDNKDSSSVRSLRMADAIEREAYPAQSAAFQQMIDAGTTKADRDAVEQAARDALVKTGLIDQLRLDRPEGTAPVSMAVAYRLARIAAMLAAAVVKKAKLDAAVAEPVTRAIEDVVEAAMGRARRQLEEGAAKLAGSGAPAPAVRIGPNEEQFIAALLARELTEWAARPCHGCTREHAHALLEVYVELESRGLIVAMSVIGQAIARLPDARRGPTVGDASIEFADGSVVRLDPPLVAESNDERAHGGGSNE